MTAALTSDVAAIIRQAIHNSHDATYRFPDDVEAHVESVTRILLSRILGADPDTPTTAREQLLARYHCRGDAECAPTSGKHSELCENEYRRPDAPVDDGLVERLADVLREIGGQIAWSYEDVARKVVVARPWQAEVDAARQDAHALAKAWDDGWFSARQVDRAIPKPGDNPYRAARGETRQP